MSGLKKDAEQVLIVYKSGQQYPVHGRYHHALVAAWMGREAFITVVGLYEETVTVRLPDVTGLYFWTEEQLNELRTEEEAERLHG